MPKILPFLTAELDGGEYSASPCGRFVHGKELPVHVGYTARRSAELADLLTKRLGKRTSVLQFVGSHFIMPAISHALVTKGVLPL
jgi:hypothetical protein